MLGKSRVMSQIHAKTDKLTLVAVPQPDGKVRITSNSWDDPVVLLPTAVLELRCVDRRVSTIRHPEVNAAQTINGKRVMVQRRRPFAVFVGERPVKKQ